VAPVLLQESWVFFWETFDQSCLSCKKTVVDLQQEGSKLLWMIHLVVFEHRQLDFQHSVAVLSTRALLEAQMRWSCDTPGPFDNLPGDDGQNQRSSSAQSLVKALEKMAQNLIDSSETELAKIQEQK